MQYSTTLRNNQLDQVEATTGTSPKLQIRSGAAPANCAASDSGTLLAEITLPSDWMANASGGSKSKSGTWSVAATAGGTAGHFRVKDSAGTTCHIQGTCGAAVTISTNALTAANGNVLNFASTTGVSVGMLASGTGVPAGATVIAVGGSTVTLSHSSSAGVSNATAITFGWEMNVDNAVIGSGQTVTVNTFTLSAGNA